nr:hypothetical protein CFP56_60736 [Quercus suber]
MIDIVRVRDQPMSSAESHADPDDKAHRRDIIERPSTPTVAGANLPVFSVKRASMVFSVWLDGESGGWPSYATSSDK